MIHPTALIGEPPEHRDWKPGDPMHPPLISDSAKIGAFVTVDSGLKSRTFVGNRTMVMKHCHLGHDVWVSADCELAVGVVLAGHVILEQGVRVGVNACVRPGVRVGKGARIGAGAVVVKDVPPDEVWVGNPARKLEKPAERAIDLLPRPVESLLDEDDFAVLREDD